MAKSWTGPRVQWEHRPARRGGRRTTRKRIAERERALARAPLFADLPRRHLRAIARASSISDYLEGATVVKEGARGSVFFVILNGRAKVVRKGRTLARLKRGDFFGEMSLLDGEPRSASVITETPTTFLLLSGRDLAKVLASDSVIALRLLREMAGRLRARERPLLG